MDYIGNVHMKSTNIIVGLALSWSYNPS